LLLIFVRQLAADFLNLRHGRLVTAVGRRNLQSSDLHVLPDDLHYGASFPENNAQT